MEEHIKIFDMMLGNRELDSDSFHITENEKGMFEFSYTLDLTEIEEE
tara:strand:+ start:331 stop:471 length:141 start_codon:yes stop_codon:yes gene_type:complete